MLVSKETKLIVYSFVIKNKECSLNFVSFDKFVLRTAEYASFNGYISQLDWIYDNFELISIANNRITETTIKIIHTGLERSNTNIFEWLTKKEYTNLLLVCDEVQLWDKAIIGGIISIHWLEQFLSFSTYMDPPIGNPYREILMSLMCAISGKIEVFEWYFSYKKYKIDENAWVVACKN